MQEEVQNTDEAISYEELSELNDMKQHADKIIQGIKKLEEGDANRAIWELFQNAVDLSNVCEVTIELHQDYFLFEHNGEPFTPMTLDCLFKQVSSKTLEESKTTFEDHEPVGQYGTGFMTSHTFGKRIHISGGLAKNNGYVELKDFLIDRNTNNWKELGNRIRLLKKEVGRILKDGDVIQKPFPSTVFRFEMASQNNKNYAVKAVESLSTILPYVMTLNSRLNKVTVKNLAGETTVYHRKGTTLTEDVHCTSVMINQQTLNVYYLKSEDRRMTVILPFAEDFTAVDLSPELPRLFLFYPLIGTQNFGFNFLLHSRHFLPNEPRSGIYLKSDNEDNQTEEIANQGLIALASKLIFDYVQENCSRIKNPVKLAGIYFKTNHENTLLNDYFQALKSAWIARFKTFPLVESRKGNILVSQAVFIEFDVLSETSVFDALYTLVDYFWENTPVKHIAKEWSSIIDEWMLEEIQYIGYKELAVKIMEVGSIQNIPFDKELKILYQYLISRGDYELFRSFSLLPNIKGEFRSLSDLSVNSGLTEEMIGVADVIMPEKVSRLVDNDYILGLELQLYARKNFSADLNNAVSEVLKDKTTSMEIPSDFLAALIQYSKISSTADSLSVPAKLMRCVCTFYDYDAALWEVPNDKDDELDNRPTQKRLLRLFLNDVSLQDPQWVKDNLDFLNDVFDIGHAYYDYEEIYNAMPIYPNQLYELRTQNFLKIDEDIPDSIKDLYDIIIKPDFPVRSRLINKEFNPYLKSKDRMKVRNLTDELEALFFDDAQYESIEDHPLKEYITDIIKKFKSEEEYQSYFPLIFSRRSSILVQLADGDDSFSILSLESGKIKQLAELGRNPHAEEIIKLGKQALLQKQQNDSDFEHKRKIGTHIENILRGGLSGLIPSSIKVDVKNVQDGQDIIISIEDKPVYFIEVKSRWDPNNSVRMSKNQTLRAFEQQSNYSLCSIDMTRYKGENKYNIKDIEEIREVIRFNNDIGENVTHLIEVLSKSNDDETIHLDGDLKTLIPQTYIGKGKQLEEFELFIVDFLSKSFFL